MQNGSEFDTLRLISRKLGSKEIENLDVIKRLLIENPNDFGHHSVDVICLPQAKIRNSQLTIESFLWYKQAYKHLDTWTKRFKRLNGKFVEEKTARWKLTTGHWLETSE